VDVLVVIDDRPGTTLAPLGNAAAGARVVKAAGAPMWPEDQTQALLSRGGCLLPWRLEAVLGDEPAARRSRARAAQWLGTELAQGWRPMVNGPQAVVDDVLGLTRQASHAAPRWLAPPADATVPVMHAHLTPAGLRREGTYLISGGTAGFGLELALWLGRQGVRQVVLISRSGRVSAQDEPRLARLRQSGCRVLEWAVDIGDESSLKRLLAGPALGEIPLRGVFHCAAVLEDALLEDITPAGLQRVLAPKVDGAMALHRATIGLALDCFVLFSSVSALLGPPGQAAYAAANACLDAMASWRQAQGLPATSIAWGAIGDTGMAARRQGLIALLEMQGISALHTRQALQALEQILRDAVQGPMGVFDVDWHRWRNGRGRLPQRLLELAGGQVAAGNALDALRERLARLDDTERVRVLAADLGRQLAAILRIDEHRLLPGQPVAQLGLDSLTSLEWVLAIQQSWGLEVSAAELAAAFSPEHLARTLVRRVLS
jgi:NAD(P)-dependent dehydrogenase (short-subunit alcohol dehydrogenase family)/acyl carrier protein